MRVHEITLAAALLLAGEVSVAGTLHAQDRSSDITIEASILRGALGYARAVGGSALIGVEAGFGFPQIDRTLVPEKSEQTGEPDFEEYLHAAVFVRHAPSPRYELDAGLRASISDLWSCSASDCWPAPFAGAYIQPMVGWQRVKLGARLTAGWISESKEGGSQSTTFTAALNPLVVRVTF